MGVPHLLCRRRAGLNKADLGSPHLLTRILIIRPTEEKLLRPAQASRCTRKDAHTSVDVIPHHQSSVSHAFVAHPSQIAHHGALNQQKRRRVQTRTPRPKVLLPTINTPLRNRLRPAHTSGRNSHFLLHSRRCHRQQRQTSHQQHAEGNRIHPHSDCGARERAAKHRILNQQLLFSQYERRQCS